MTECKACKRNFSEVGIHWRHSPECRPEFSKIQKDILKGLLMGDGTLHRSSKNSCIVVEMTNKEYLESLYSIFPYLSTEPILKHTSKEAAERKPSGFNKEPKAKNYSSTYTWRTRRHPWLNNLKSWYDSGSKVWPKDLDLPSETLKSLYVSDGSFEKVSENGYRLHISMNNERKNKKKVEKYFERNGLPTPDYWAENKSGRVNRCKARWYTENASELFDYMGAPPPGFEYKWPECRR